MKKILIMAGVGVALFAGTVFGLLWAGGRLNYKGTRGIPLVNGLFEAPPKTPEELAKEEEEIAKKAAEGHGDGHGAGSHKEFGPLDGPSKIKPVADSGGGHGGGHGAPAADSHAAGPVPTVVKETGGLGAWYASSLPEDLRSIERHFPGAFFAFKRQESVMDASDLEDLRQYIEGEEKRLETAESALAGREDELSREEKRIEEKWAKVTAGLGSIESDQMELNNAIDEFNDRRLNLEKDGRNAALKLYAEDLGRLVENDSQKARDLIVDVWNDKKALHDPKQMMIQIFDLMGADSFNQILGEMDVKMIQDVMNDRVEFRNENERKKGQG